MTGRFAAGLVALVVLGVTFAFGLSKQRDVSYIDTARLTVPRAGFHTFTAAAITGTSFAGTPFSLATLHGKPIFINFWGSWCAPCRREAPELRAFSRSLGHRAALVGVAYQSPRDKAIAFARKARWGYPIVSAPCCGLGDRYGVVALPTTIVVDPAGQVVDRLVGPQTAARLTAELHALDAYRRSPSAHS
jgi:thiol-disulfide isomerase/thioredoxin